MSRCIAIGGGWVDSVSAYALAFTHDLVVAGDVARGALVAPVSLRRFLMVVVHGARRDRGRALTYCACLLMLLLRLTGTATDVLEVVRGVRLGL